MKIAFIISSTGWGGLEMNTIKLAENLKEKGLEIVLFTQDTSTIFQKGKAVFHSISLIDKKRKYFDFSCAKSIAQNLKQHSINQIMVFDNKDLDVVTWAKKCYFKKLRIVYQQHMQIGIKKKDFLHTFRFKAIDKWISPLQYLKQELGECTHFPLDRVEVVPLCMEINRFIKPKYSKNEARIKLSISNEVQLVGIIGRISEKKGQLFLTKCIQNLQNKGHEIELLIFGSATQNDQECQDYFQNLQKYVIAENLTNTVHFVPYQPDVSLFYNAVDVFALASHSETYGMVTIEAMLSKVPVIATQSGGTSELLDYGKLGELYEYENRNQFCSKLVGVFTDFQQAETRAKMAYELAIKRYNLSVEINAIHRILDQF